MKIIRLILPLLLLLASIYTLSTADNSDGVQSWHYHQNRFEQVRIKSQAAHRLWETSINRLPVAHRAVQIDEHLLTFYNGSLEISRDGIQAWKSPESWEIVQVESADLNRDGEEELILLVWRPFAPWPVDRYLPNPGRIESFQNDSGRSCHVILLGWRAGSYRELWAGSALSHPLLSIAAADLDGNGYPELVALESSYSASPNDSAQALTAWEWNGFGFTLLDRAAGRFREMKISSNANGNPVILVKE